MFGEDLVAGGDEGVIVVGSVVASLRSCVPGVATITEVLVAPWSKDYFFGVGDGEIFGDGELMCVESPATPSPFVAISHGADGTCAVMYAVTADAVYREYVDCTE